MIYKDNDIQVFNKSCNDMGELDDNSIQCCVTSPPYWGLRKYAGEQSDNGFDCAYGLEPTPELYVEHTVQILREIRRVLRPDGVCFWNIGDSYSGGHRKSNPNQGFARDKYTGHAIDYTPSRDLTHDDIKPKDLCLIPQRVMIAAQSDGWWVRSVIIWDKPNPMPESVTDRPTTSHEYIIMLTKSAKYYWDKDAIREPQRTPMDTKSNQTFGAAGGKAEFIYGSKVSGELWEPSGYRNARSVWSFPTQPYPEAHFATFPQELPERCIKAASKEGDLILDPFAGSGTTLWVAKRLNRKAIGYEISKEYCELIIKRNRQQTLC